MKFLAQSYESFQSLQSAIRFVNNGMGKRGKAGGQPFGRGETRQEDGGYSRLKINTYEDVADSEDEFHINRDKVLLEEGPAQKRLRKAREEGSLNFSSSKQILS